MKKLTVTVTSPSVNLTEVIISTIPVTLTSIHLTEATISIVLLTSSSVYLTEATKVYLTKIVRISIPLLKLKQLK